MRNLWKTIKYWFERQTGLAEAAKNGDVNTVCLLLDQGADIEMQSSYATPLMLSAVGGHVETVRLLLDKGARINPQILWDWDSFTHAILGDNLEIVQLFIEHGADVNTRDPEHEITVLMYAAGGGNIEIVRLLIDHGAEVNAYDWEGRTALTYAKQEQHSEVVQLLKQRGGIEQEDWVSGS